MLGGGIFGAWHEPGRTSVVPAGQPAPGRAAVSPPSDCANARSASTDTRSSAPRLARRAAIHAVAGLDIISFTPGGGSACRCVGDWAGGAEQRLELVDLSRLDHVLVEPCRAALVAPIRVAETGQRDEEQRIGRILLAQPASELDAVHPLECDVQDRAIGAKGLGERESGLAIARGRDFMAK